jgi:hypothetical protein
MAEDVTRYLDRSKLAPMVQRRALDVGLLDLSRLWPEFFDA